MCVSVCVCVCECVCVCACVCVCVRGSLIQCTLAQYTTSFRMSSRLGLYSSTGISSSKFNYKRKFDKHDIVHAIIE